MYAFASWWFCLLRGKKEFCPKMQSLMVPDIKEDGERRRPLWMEELVELLWKENFICLEL